MSFFTEKQGEIEHDYFQAGPGKKIYLGRKDRPETVKLENIRKALSYLDQKNQHYYEITNKLISKLSQEDKDKILPEVINELYKTVDVYAKYLSDSLKQQYLSKGMKTAEDQTRLRLPPLTVSVLGFNRLGKFLTYGLQKLETKIIVYDSDEENLLDAKLSGIEIVDKKTAVRTADVIICCTGKKILKSEEFYLLKNNVTLIDVSIDGIEIDKDWLDQIFSTIETYEDDYWIYQLNNQRIHLMHKWPTSESDLIKIFTKVLNKEIDELPYSNEDLLMLEVKQKTAGRKSMFILLPELLSFKGTKEQLVEKIQTDLRYNESEAYDLIEHMLKKGTLKKTQLENSDYSLNTKKTFDITKKNKSKKF